ncbi:unnamed protein product [Sphagnum troendelagicum]|uniref:Vicilin-like seed storage protein n=1 Tax=Sphagnum troendelagicum TaxID=128251 RepID=A0ABP0UEN7_9BRYO
MAGGNYNGSADVKEHENHRRSRSLERVDKSSSRQRRHRSPSVSPPLERASSRRRSAVAEDTRERNVQKENERVVSKDGDGREEVLGRRRREQRAGNSNSGTSSSDDGSRGDEDEESNREEDEGDGDESDKGRKKRKADRNGEKKRKRRHRSVNSDSEEVEEEESDHTGDNSAQSSEDSEEERRKARRRKRRKRREREEREREKEQHRRRKNKKRKLKEKERELEKRKRKKEKVEKRAKGPITSSWGKYGLIKEIDMWTRRPEFSAWLAEVKKVNLETLTTREEKDMFKQYMEDYNTATFPSKKYYNIDIYHRRKMTKMHVKGMKKLAKKQSERTEFNDEEQKRQEMMTERAKQKEAEVEALKRSMQSGMGQAMREQAVLREEMQYHYRLGNFEAAAAIQRRLDPDLPGAGK